MASRQLYPVVGANSPEQVCINFRFQINGTSDPDALLPYNSVVSNVTRASEGLFNVTLTELYPTFICGSGSIFGATANGLTVEFVSWTASTGVLVVRTVDPSEGATGTEADAPAAIDDPPDNHWVCVQAVFCRRNNLAPSGAI